MNETRIPWNILNVNQLFSFSSNKDRRTDSRIWSVAVSSSIFVGAKREELIRNDPDKSEFTILYVGNIYVCQFLLLPAYFLFIYLLNIYV